MDFETEMTDVMSDPSTLTEEQITETSVEETEVEPQETAEVQADIQDSTQSQSVPYDRFQEIVKHNQQLTDQVNMLMQLQLNNKSQQQQEQKAPEFDIEDDAFLTGADVKRLLQNIESKRQQETQTFTQSTREQMLIQHETVFRQANPDYDIVISNIPKSIVNALMQSITSPAELIAEAYKLGKAYAPVKPTAAEIASQANKAKPAKAVTLNSVKGSAIPKGTEKVSFETEFKAGFGG
jgi:hypothetical protein